MISLLIAVPLLLAFLSAIWKKSSGALLVIASLINLVIVLSLWSPGSAIVHEMGGWKPPFGINLVYDSASFFTLLVVNSLFFLFSLYPWLIENYGTVSLVLLSALNGFVLTGDLFNSFVFLEIIAASSVMIAAKRANYYNAFKYLIFSGLAGAFYLLATIFVYAGTGSLNMAQTSSISIATSAVIAMTTLYIIGLGVEAKLFPLNGWVSGVYGGTDAAPVILSSAVSFAVMYMVGRVFITVFHGKALYIIYPLALLTIVAGELSALFQKNLLKTLAYSSVAQAGIVLAMISKGTEESLKLGYFHLTNDVLAKFALFSVAAFLVYRYPNLNGIFRRHKFLGLSFTIASFSLIGFPMFAGFRSKLLIIMEAFKMGDYILPAVILFGTLIEVAYLIRWNVRLWFEEGEETKAVEVPAGLNVIPFILSVILILVFIWPDPILSKLGSMAGSIHDWSAYVKAVLGGM